MPPIQPPDFADRPTAADAEYEVGTLDDAERILRFLAIFRHARIIETLRADREAGRLDIDSYSWEVFNAIADVLPGLAGLDADDLRGAIASLPELSGHAVSDLATQGAGEAAEAVEPGLSPGDSIA